jgi:hypothetical protein
MAFLIVTSENEAMALHSIGTATLRDCAIDIHGKVYGFIADMVYMPEENSWQLAGLVKLNLANIFTTLPPSQLAVLKAFNTKLTPENMMHAFNGGGRQQYQNGTTDGTPNANHMDPSLHSAMKAKGDILFHQAEDEGMDQNKQRGQGSGNPLALTFTQADLTSKHGTEDEENEPGSILHINGADTIIVDPSGQLLA